MVCAMSSAKLSSLQSRKPQFFIAGAPKCGTTALFKSLLLHPSIFIPAIKEPNFYCTDLKALGGVHTRKAYDALFSPAPSGATTGEASSLYLYSKVAIPRIMDENPGAKIIVILRKPTDAAHSYHAAAWGYGHEDIADFEEAWGAQTARLAERRVPPGWPDPQTLQYGAMYNYANQIRRLQNCVPQRQQRVFLYEEFFAEPQRHFADLLSFLDLELGGPVRFPIINPAVGPRSLAIERLLRKPPRWLKAIYAPMRPLFHAVGVYPNSVAWHLNTTPRPKMPLRAAFRAELDRFFASDIAELEKLLGRTLWRTDSSPVKN
jgi:Sulfotransferase domain